MSWPGWDVAPPWPEGVQPEPDQVADWLETATPADRRRYVHVTSAGLAVAQECWASNHQGLLEHRAAVPAWWTPAGIVGP